MLGDENNGEVIKAALQVANVEKKRRVDAHATREGSKGSFV